MLYIITAKHMVRASLVHDYPDDGAGSGIGFGIRNLVRLIIKHLLFQIIYTHPPPTKKITQHGNTDHILNTIIIFDIWFNLTKKGPIRSSLPVHWSRLPLVFRLLDISGPFQLVVCWKSGSCSAASRACSEFLKCSAKIVYFYFPSLNQIIPLFQHQTNGWQSPGRPGAAD